MLKIHGHLLQGVRGENKDPGEFRRTQNWIGPQGRTLATATFVPPPVPDMTESLGNLELFLHDRSSLPLTVQCALMHAQFETVHPFLDGNGRIGRLMVSLLLHERGVLKQPLLYISLFLKENRAEYYDRLMDVRKNGNWEGWVKFFLTGITQVSNEAALTAQHIVEFRENTMIRARAFGKNESALIDLLFEHPIMDIRTAERLLGCTYVSASTALQNLKMDGCVAEVTGQKRNRLYKFVGYLNLFEPEQQMDRLDGAENAEVKDDVGDDNRPRFRP